MKKIALFLILLFGTFHSLSAETPNSSIDNGNGETPSTAPYIRPKSPMHRGFYHRIDDVFLIIKMNRSEGWATIIIWDENGISATSEFDTASEFVEYIGNLSGSISVQIITSNGNIYEKII